MTATLYKVTVGFVTVACFASDASEAIHRSCECIADQYGIDVDPDNVFANVERISTSDIDFNDEVY